MGGKRTDKCANIRTITTSKKKNGVIGRIFTCVGIDRIIFWKTLLYLVLPFLVGRGRIGVGEEGVCVCGWVGERGEWWDRKLCMIGR